MTRCIIKHVHGRANNIDVFRPDNNPSNCISRWTHSLFRAWEPPEIQLFGVMFVTWGACVAFVFYLYGTIIQKNIISTSWEFGQIIAVTSLVPFLVESIYIQCSRFDPISHTHGELDTNGIYPEGIEKGSRYRYPPGLQVTRTDEKRNDAASPTSQLTLVHLYDTYASLGSLPSEAGAKNSLPDEDVYRSKAFHSEDLTEDVTRKI